MSPSQYGFLDDGTVVQLGRHGDARCIGAQPEDLDDCGSLPEPTTLSEVLSATTWDVPEQDGGSHE